MADICRLRTIRIPVSPMGQDKKLSQEIRSTSEHIPVSATKIFLFFVILLV